MPRIAYVNGRYVRHADACVHIEDRGYQFADGVYEVCEVARGYIVDMTGHLDRLGRSLSELQMAWPMSRSTLEIVVGEVVRAGVDGEPIILEAPLRFSVDPGALRVLVPEGSPASRQVPPLEAGWHAAQTLLRWLRPPQRS